jgi:hypothetical protein
MSQEELGDEISKDPKAAAAYARYQARQQKGAEPDASGIAAASTVYAYSAQVTLNAKLLKESDLPADKKAELAGTNFVQDSTTGAPRGTEGLLAWGEAIQTALIGQAAEVRAQELLSEKWETFREEKLADEDPERPPVIQGDKTRPMGDLLGESSEAQLEHAFESKK